MSHKNLLPLLPEVIEGPIACPYLRGQIAHFAQGELTGEDADEYENLLATGYRKFGGSVFRPVCQSCSACIPIRLEVSQFRPSRSQKRTLKSNLDLQVSVQAAVCNEERIALFLNYHFAKFIKKNWPLTGSDEDRYTMEFLSGPIPLLEVSIHLGNRCIGVLLLDETSQALSAIYHYYDPKLSYRGLGTFLILRGIQEAITRQKKYFYLGYFVDGSSSMAYKANFRPLQRLTDGQWKAFDVRSFEEGISNAKDAKGMKVRNLET